MDVNFIMEYEDGQLSEEEMIAGFQEMIDDGTVWQLQGNYGRTAKRLIDGGFCTSPVS